MVLLYLAIAILFCILSLILYARWNYGSLESLSIPVVPRTFLFGSCPKFYKTCPQYEDIQRFQKHGNVYGIYEGRTAKVMIADPDLVKLIMGRDFEHFQHRAPFDFGHNIPNEVLDFLQGKKWEKVRQLLEPKLTSSRLQELSKLTFEVADEFTKDLLVESQGGRMEIDFRNRVLAILLDIAASGLYGIEIENRRDPNNVMIELMKGIMCERVKYDFRYTFTMVFPFLKFFVPNWPFPSEGLEQFRRVMHGYLKTRRQDNKSHNDFGDVLVDMINLVDSPDYVKLGLSEDTAIAQVIQSFFSSSDLTGTALTMLLYYLCQNQEIQDKVLEEVDTIWDRYEGNLTVEAVNDLTYLTACLNESLRLASPILRTERKCTKSWMGYGDNGVQIKFPKNTNVVFPLWALHRNPQYFPDPEKFEPERFMPENKKKLHPYAFCPFGHGARNCIGVQFANNNMKIIMCRLLKDFRFEMRSDTKLSFKRGTRFFLQYAPIYFDIVKRK